MVRFIRKMFGIYSGEGKRAFHFALLSFLWSLGISITETLSISLLVEKIGSSMIPLTNIFTSIGMIAFSALFLVLLKKYPPYKIFLGILFCSIAFYIAILPFLGSSFGSWYWILLQMMTYIFVAVLIASYWSFVDEHHDLQDAKRAYGIYNATYFLGNVVAGLLINCLVGKVGIYPLFLITIGTLILSFFHTQIFAPRIGSIEEDKESLPLSTRKKYSSFFQLLYQSPFVLSLIGMSLLVQLIRTTTEYSYLQSLANFFNPTFSTVTHIITENSLAQFLGKCHAYISLGNILFGLFFYRKFVKRIGLGNIIMIPPLVFFGLYQQWIIYNSMWITVGAILAVEWILFSLEDNNFNLLIGAAPNKLRGSLRIINDSFFEPIGMLLSSLLLIFLQKGNLYIGFILAIVLSFASLMVRKNYPRSILNNLRENAIRFDRGLSDWIRSFGKKDKQNFKNTLIHCLEKEKNSSIRLLAWSSLLAFHDNHLLENTLLPQLASFSVTEKIQLLQELEQHPFAQHPMVLSTITSWLHYTQHPSLVTKARFYLAKLGLIHPSKVKKDIHSQDLTKKATAIITLKQSLENRSLPQAAHNQSIAFDETDKLLQSDKIEEILMGLEITQKGSSQDFSPIILELLEHDSLIVQRKAAQTLSAIADISLAKFVPLLINYMKKISDQKIRLFCLETLGKIKDLTHVKEVILASTHFRTAEKRKIKSILTELGSETIPILLSILHDPEIHNSCRILSSKILGKVAPALLRSQVTKVIEKEIAQGYFYAFHAFNIAKNYPLDSLIPLQKALETGYESTTHFIIHLLVAGSTFEDSEMLVHSLRSTHPKVKAQAIETLETYCSPKLFRKIYPLIEDSPWEEKLEICRSVYGPQPHLNLPELLSRLLLSSSLFEKTIALQLKTKLRLPGWQDSIIEEWEHDIDQNQENITHIISEHLEKE